MAITKGLTLKVFAPITHETLKDIAAQNAVISAKQAEIRALELVKALRESGMRKAYDEYAKYCVPYSPFVQGCTKLFDEFRDKEKAYNKALDDLQYAQRNLLPLQSDLKVLKELHKFNTSQRFVAYYTSTSENASDAMTFEFTTELVGGLKEWTVTFKNKPTEPLDINSEFQFFVDGYHWYTGYSTEVESFTNDSSTFTVKGVGYWDRLKTLKVSKSTAQWSDLHYTLSALARQARKELSIFPDIPDITKNDAFKGIYTTGLDLEGTPIDEALETCSSLVNADKSNLYVHAYVGKNRNLRVESVDYKQTDTPTTLIEGYAYYSHDAERDSSNLVNSVDLYYKTKDKEIKYTTESDDDSIRQYGKKQAKIVFSGKADANSVSARKLTQSILNTFKQPLSSLTLKDVEVTEPYPFRHQSKYKLINSPREDAIELESLWHTDLWNTGKLGFYGQQDEIVLYNHVEESNNSVNLHKSLKINIPERTNNAFYSNDMYIETVYDHPIIAPKKIKGHYYVTNDFRRAKIIFYDSYGNDIINTINGYSPLDKHDFTIKQVWHKFEFDTAPTFCHDLMTVKKSAESEPELFHVHSPTAKDGDVMGIECLGEKGLFDIKKIKVEFMRRWEQKAETSFLINNFSAIVESHKHYNLTLKKAKYKIGHTRTCELEFGDKRETLIDAFKTEAKRADRTIDIAT